MSDFTGKVGLVTAGERHRPSKRGRLLERGAAVGVLDIREQDAAETADLVHQAGGRAPPVVVDVGDEASVSAAVPKSLTPSEAWTSPLQRWDSRRQRDARGVAPRAVGPRAPREPDRRVPVPEARVAEMVTPGAGVLERAVRTPRDARLRRQHGVVGLSKAAAVDCAPHGIRPNCLCPHPPSRRCMWRSPLASTSPQQAAATPLGRVAQAEEIAVAAVWLCSSEASYVTAIAMFSMGDAAPEALTYPCRRLTAHTWPVM
jgi:hypothetical protein